MITSQNRAWYIGASDSSMVVGNWKTETFKKWWQSKLGLDRGIRFDNKFTLAGTHYEHAILDTIPGVVKDKQIILPELALRVNYDGIIEGDTIVIKEVKTHKEDKEFKVSKLYWRQAQVEIFAAEKYYGKPVRLDIVSYPMTEKHYRNYFIEVDRDMIRTTPVDKDPAFIGEYLPKLEYLKHCMEIGAFPTEGGYRRVAMKNLSSKRAKACAIPTKVKHKVWERDNHCSIFSGSPYAFPECHYIPRSQGGLGIEENIFTATREEHFKHDSGTPEEREYYHRKAREYFQRIYPDWSEEDLYYKKYGGEI